MHKINVEPILFWDNVYKKAPPTISHRGRGSQIEVADGEKFVLKFKS